MQTGSEKSEMIKSMLLGNRWNVFSYLHIMFSPWCVVELKKENKEINKNHKVK